MPKTRDIAPTREQFTAFELQFAYFNGALFEGALPTCLLNFSRKSKTNGFFAPERWEAGKSVRHEISLNPSTLKTRKPIDVASTLVHEMVHLWQHESGDPSRTGYHNHEWASKMESIGLMPSATAAPGGARVGQRVSHYIIEGGAFAKAFSKMPKSHLLPWSCGEEPDAKKATAAKAKTKYSCPSCEANVWGKPGLALLCVDCDVVYLDLEA